MGKEPDELFDKVFSFQPECSESPAIHHERVYPELLLHQAPHAAQYYGSLQQFTRQFVDEESHRSIVQFSSSKLEQLLREKVNAWNSNDSEARLNSADRDMTVSVPVSSNSAVNSLFSWSTSDSSIAARKRQLQERSATSPSLNGRDSNATESRPSLPLPAPRLPKALVMQRLTHVIEKESNRFIQDRIEVIKAHHRREASKKIDERKRKDHEMHLQRIKRKEEEYERSLKAAIALQNMNRQSGFFGTLFGLSLKQYSSSFTLDILESDPPSYPPPAVASPTIVKPKTPIQAKSKRSAFFPTNLFRSSNKSLRSLVTTSPQSTSRAETSFDNSSTKSVVTSDPETAHDADKDNFVAFDGLDEVLGSLDQTLMKKVDNPLTDISSSPSKDNLPSTHQFIALKPANASNTSKEHLVNDTEDLLLL